MSRPPDPYTLIPDDLSEWDGPITYEEELTPDDFGAGPAPSRKPLDPQLLALIRKTRVMSAVDLSRLPAPTWFIQDLLPHVPRTMLHGKGGSYKSFVMLDWMLAAATHRDWHEHEVRPGHVLYIAGEGGGGINKRIAAWCARNDTAIESLTNIDFMIDPINLTETERTQVWQGFFDHLQYDYVVIDTLHMASAGAEENSSTEMGKVLENATRMVGPDTSLFFVHHMTKAGGTHRGSGALRDDIDVSISLNEVEGVDYTAQLLPDKLRDAERFKPINICFAKHGEGIESSLYVSSISTNAKRIDTSTKPPAAEARAAEAITKHDLDIEWGQKRMTQALKDLDLGYNFSPSTVGLALAHLRGKSQEVKNMRAHSDIQLDPEDQ